MDVKQNDSLEVDAIIERIKNKLSERHNNVLQGNEVKNSGNIFSNRNFVKPLLLSDSKSNFDSDMYFNDPNIIPNPFNDFETQPIIDLTPNMEVNQRSNKGDLENIISIDLNEEEYKLFIEVLSKRFSKAFYMPKLQPKIEKWLDSNLKDLLISK